MRPNSAKGPRTGRKKPRNRLRNAEKYRHLKYQPTTAPLQRWLCRPSLAALDAHESGRLPPNEADAHFDEFNEQRIRIYGYLAMIAPQAVMDAQDKLIDNLLLVAHGNAKYEWEKVRENALAMLNAVRIDVGIDKSPISYNGEL